MSSHVTNRDLDELRARVRELEGMVNLNLHRFAAALNREFGEPFLPAGEVSASVVHRNGEERLILRIGPRDVEITSAGMVRKGAMGELFARIAKLEAAHASQVERLTALYETRNERQARITELEAALREIVERAEADGVDTHEEAPMALLFVAETARAALP